MKDIINPFRLKKEIKRFKDTVLRNIKYLLEYEKKKTIVKFLSDNYIEYKSNSDKNRIVSVEEYLLS